LCLVFFEIALRGYHVIKKKRNYVHTNQDHSVPLHILIDSPALYGLNPEHPQISSQGLRDDEVTVPKPKGTFRILVLGDSVTYGVDVLKSQAFPDRLEGFLRDQFSESVEVINAGVSGYTAYNELQYYLTQGRKFEPDLVIVASCMNDVVNPRLHWDFTGEMINNIPEGAIPNHDYDLNHVLPKMQRRKKTQSLNIDKGKLSLLENSRLYNSLRWRIRRLFQAKTENIPNVKSEIPTFITGEDTLSIEVLCDEFSSEWRWLTSVYDQLRRAVKADKATLIIVIFPLAYQLDKNYPFLPQANFAQYCRKNSIYCIDLLTSFKQHPKEDIFFLNASRYYDIWHLTKYGHDLCAKEISNFLKEKGILGDRKKNSKEFTFEAETSAK